MTSDSVRLGNIREKGVVIADLSTGNRPPAFQRRCRPQNLRSNRLRQGVKNNPLSVLLIYVLQNPTLSLFNPCQNGKCNCNIKTVMFSSRKKNAGEILSENYSGFRPTKRNTGKQTMRMKPALSICFRLSTVSEICVKNNFSFQWQVGGKTRASNIF